MNSNYALKKLKLIEDGMQMKKKNGEERVLDFREIG